MFRNGVLKLKAQIFCGSEFAIGPGKADLLESIDTEGSISAAGRALGMSYRRTWMLVDSMNRCWVEKLVETTAGGGASKGARLTPCGRAVLDAFRTLERELADTAARGSLDTLTALLLDMPRSPSAAAAPEN
jgi:molybdate transport system regulatory protein